eukprot:4405073-Lingulodinium_polyedra.AAC.1
MRQSVSHQRVNRSQSVHQSGDQFVNQSVKQRGHLPVHDSGTVTVIKQSVSASQPVRASQSGGRS